MKQFSLLALTTLAHAAQDYDTDYANAQATSSAMLGLTSSIESTNSIYLSAAEVIKSIEAAMT
jgi:hypothetical protein